MKYNHFLLLLNLFFLVACIHRNTPHRLAVEYNTNGVAHLKANRLDAAKASFLLSLEYSPSFAEPYSNIGLIYMKQQRYQIAKNYFIKAINFNNDLAQAHNNLGVAYTKLYDFAEAENSFREALKVNPHYYEARWNLIRTLIRVKKNNEARKQALILVEVNPMKADSYAILSQIDLSLGKINECRESIGNALALEANNSYALEVEGLLKIRSGNINGAIEDLGKAIKNRDDDPQLYTWFAVSHLLNNDIELSEKAVEKALIIDKNWARAWSVKGYIEYSKGANQKAIEYSEHAIKLDNDIAESWLLIARIYKNNNLEKARNAYQMFFLNAPSTMSDEKREAEEFLRN